MTPVEVTPAMAVKLLEYNKINRPLSQAHVQRIAREISQGRWQYNGDTIKVANNGDVIDGQHRLWAIIEANKPVKTIIINGIDAGAFTTIDTLRKARTYSDVISIGGDLQNRTVIATALCWLLRWEWGLMDVSSLRRAKRRVENEDIKRAFAAHPGIVLAAEKTAVIRRIANHGILACFYYVLTCHDRGDLADRLVEAMREPASLSQNHPFYQLRRWFIDEKQKVGRSQPKQVIARMIKATNAVVAGRRVETLRFIDQGPRAEKFPVLNVKKK